MTPYLTPSAHVSPAVLAADVDRVVLACAGAYTRESDIMAATGLGRSRVRMAVRQALLARRLVVHTEWMPTPRDTWRAA
jgi:hypothetical protein